ncbi:uncharacterized protein LOC131539100 isoform X2 [Onychostoma macrolepis]|uniref:uncharacterized protein LOC131539100 isoform X2 n=1 Tax=Onychostoma macrolepis TaxID=369639 RepID=UPI00272A873A|nr:uncharacterized protein LOC131539100 isoform X2 [Onychostoma macrolepis]
MNWVGGSRNRYMKSKEDTTKQRAFFQKQRMKRKSNTVDSPKGYNPDNMDLLTLFIVNQISSKKEQTDKPKTNLLTGVKRTKRALKEPSELPMSPCSPSNLNLVTSQPQYCIDTPGYKVRKHRLSEEFKFTPLSPLLESNLSDASGSENQPQPPSGSSDPIQPKPAPHISSSLPILENLNNMMNTPQFVSFSQPTKLANPWPDEALMQDVSHNSSAAGNQFQSTLPNPERGEHSEDSVLYPLNPLKSTEEPEEPLFIDFKNLDYKVLDSMNSCDRSQNMDSNDHLSIQESVCTDSNACADGSSVFVHVGKSPRGVHLSSDDKEKNDQCLQCFCPKKQLWHSEESVKAKHFCLSVDSLTETPSQAPSCQQVAKSNCDGQSETEAHRHDGTLPITLETGTQTGALFYRDVSVQCSLIHHRNSVPFPSANQKSSAFTTRWQYSNFNQLLNPTTHTSPKHGHKKTGNMPSGASATNQQAQRHPKSQMGFSFRKLHSQKSMKRDLSASKHPFCKASEQKKEERRKKTDKCDYPRLGNVVRNPVKDVQENL